MHVFTCQKEVMVKNRESSIAPYAIVTLPPRWLQSQIQSSVTRMTKPSKRKFRTTPSDITVQRFTSPRRYYFNFTNPSRFTKERPPTRLLFFLRNNSREPVSLEPSLIPTTALSLVRRLPRTTSTSLRSLVPRSLEKLLIRRPRKRFQVP